MSHDSRASWRSLEALLEQLRRSVAIKPSTESDTPLAGVTREFFFNNWATARDGLLAKTQKIRVYPEASLAPRSFRFEMAVAYKCRHGDGPVRLMPGPVRGDIHYHPSLFDCEPGVPSVAVALDSDLGFYHPNYSRRLGFVCLGGLPAGPFPLDTLLEHLYSILSYANWRSFDPADGDAAHYFATDPTALEGVGSPDPLY